MDNLEKPGNNRAINKKIIFTLAIVALDPRIAAAIAIGAAILGSENPSTSDTSARTIQCSSTLSPTTISTSDSPTSTDPIVSGIVQTPPRSQHIWLIIMQNKNASQIYGNSYATFLNSLGAQYVELKNYSSIYQQAPANLKPYAVHPSLPNYLALTSGSTWWVTSDCISDFYPVFGGTTPVDTTLGQIEGGRFMLPSKWYCSNAEVVSGCTYNTTYSGTALGTAAINRQGQRGTLIIVHNVNIVHIDGCSKTGRFPCTGGDGDQGIDVTDPTWNSGWNSIHIEITPPFENSRSSNVYGFLTRQALLNWLHVGQTVTVIGTAFCDPDHNLDVPAWHSLSANGSNTCWEIHPVISMYPEGSAPSPDPNLFSNVQDQGLSWRVLDEGMPSPCYRSNLGNYTATHNPAAFYANIASSCQIDDLPYSGTNLPAMSSVNLTMIVPNTCDSMQNCTISVGDGYLSQIVPKIMAASDYQNGGAILIVWDQGSWQSNKYETFSSPSDITLPAFIISPLVKQGYVSTVRYDHYSVLHTIEYMLGLPDMGRNDASAPMITDIWK